jgi:hypothetical protein
MKTRSIAAALATALLLSGAGCSKRSEQVSGQAIRTTQGLQVRIDDVPKPSATRPFVWPTTVPIARKAPADVRLLNVAVPSVIHPGDALRATVETEGKTPRTIEVGCRFTGPGFDRQVVKNVPGDRRAATEFEAKKSGALPRGDYQVEVLLDYASVAKKPFRVE